MRLPKNARETLDALGNELSEAEGAWGEMWGFVPDKLSRFMTTTLDNCVLFYKSFKMEGGDGIWQPSMEHMKTAMATMQLDKAEDEFHPTVRGMPLKKDCDCAVCKACTDCRMEVTWGRERKPVCDECAWWLLTGEETE